MRLATRFWVWIIALILAVLVGLAAGSCAHKSGGDDDDAAADDAGDDDAADDDAADDDAADDDSGGCAPITDPFPPSEQIYQFLDAFTPMVTYVGSYQGQLVALGENLNGSKADSLQVQFPDNLTVGQHDLRWDDDPTTNDIMGLYMVGVSVSGTYDKAFYAYRGCMDIQSTGAIGDAFSAHFTSLYMTEAQVDLGTGQIQITPPGEGLQAFIMDTTIACKIVDFSQTPSMGDMCIQR